MINRYKITSSGSLLFRHKDSRSYYEENKFKEIINLETKHGGTSLNKLKFELFPTSYSTSYWSITQAQRDKLKKQNITTLRELALAVRADNKLLKTIGVSYHAEFTKALNTILDLCPWMEDDSYTPPIRIDITVENPHPDASIFPTLEKELQKIVLEEISDRIRNELTDVVKNVHEIKRKRDIKKTESEIKKLQSKLAVLTMNTETKRAT